MDKKYIAKPQKGSKYLKYFYNLDELNTEKKRIHRLFFDIVFVVGFLAALIPGPFPQLSAVASVILLGCIMICFLDENFYLYMALFMYLRYQLLIGETPAYRVYSYLMVIRFVLDISKIKFRIAYLPPLFVFLIHSIFATGRYESLRIGFNVIVDCVLMYVVLAIVMTDERLMRKFIFVFMLGGIASGIYGWTNDEFTKDINVRGAGAHKVSRNFGALSDANFAGLFYSACTICSIMIYGLPIWLRSIFIVLFGIMLLQTASLSAMITLALMLTVFIILKFRLKSVLILTCVFVGVSIAVLIVLSVPSLREQPEIEGMLIRVSEKISYIQRGRWDLLTTDRYTLWQQAMKAISDEGIIRQLIGGGVVTVMSTNPDDFHTACHNSYLQSILNFGFIGSLVVYLPIFIVFGYRLLQHFTRKADYKNEDIKMLQIILSFSFIVFGMTVDFFIDWPYMMLYFI